MPCHPLPTCSRSIYLNAPALPPSSLARPSLPLRFSILTPLLPCSIVQVRSPPAPRSSLSGHGLPVPRQLPLRLPPHRPRRHAVPGQHRHWPRPEAQHRRVPRRQVRPRRRQGRRAPGRPLPLPRQHPRRPHRARPRRAPGRVPQLRAREAALRHDRRGPAARRRAPEHAPAQDPVHQLGPRAHEAGAGAAGRGRCLLRRRRVLRDHEPAPLRGGGGGGRRGCGRRRPPRRRPETVRPRLRHRPARRRHKPTSNALPRRQREEHRRGESARPPHSPGWQEGEEQGGGLRAGDHRRPPASHPGDLGRRGGRRPAAARPQRGEEQEHEGRAGRRHPANVHPGLIDRPDLQQIQSRRNMFIMSM